MQQSVRGVASWAIAVCLAFGMGSAWAKGPPGGKPGDGGGTTIDHKARQDRPISLGVSGGSTTELANGYCCSGTLGALVQDASGVQYLLSNTHVLAGDSVAGGNGKVASVGDPVNQPGYIDIQCQDLSADYVGNLSNWIPIVAGGTTTADAAIATVVPGAVNPSGAILKIGTIAADPVAAYINQPVKKSGRTSGLTRGKIYLLNATISVSYENECAGSPFISTYENQILVSPGKFLKGGDSGSLLVEDVNTNPAPLGLLFAGSSRVAIANPIGDVLSALNVSMVGAAASSSSSAASGEGGNVPRGLAKAAQAKARGAARLMSVPGAIGHAVGNSNRAPGEAAIKVLVETITPEARRALPRQIDSVRVELTAVGHITAY